MKKEERLELLKNKKQSRSLGVSTAVVLFIGIFTGINTILILIDLSGLFSGFWLKIFAVASYVILTFAALTWARRIASSINSYGLIDKYIFDTVKGQNTKEIEDFIKKEYDFEETKKPHRNLRNK